MERTTSIASYDGKRKEIKKGGKESKKLLQMGEKKMFPLAKARLSAKKKEKMNDRSQNVT